jgi:release factor glutamine methyltransferase
VENSLKYIDKTKNVLDLCTGSGAIAISIKKQTDAVVSAIDKSVDALCLAKENAKLNEVDIEFIESDMFSKIDGRKFDVIISNPPYIKSQDILTLQKEVKDFEPIMALDGGESGYDFYNIIAENAPKYLNEGGVLLLECGVGQAQDIAKTLTAFSSVEIIKDYENIDRIIKAVL